MSRGPHSLEKLKRNNLLQRRPIPAVFGIALACLFPFTAVLHHAFFYHPTCMLNNFGADYTLRVVANWLHSDASPYLGLLGAISTFALPIFEIAALAFAIVTIPLSLWIWDIPFTGRLICRLGHDGRLTLNTFDLYILAAISFGPIMYWLWRRSTPAPDGPAEAWLRCQTGGSGLP